MTFYYFDGHLEFYSEVNRDHSHNILLQKRAGILHLFVFMFVFVAILNLFAMHFENTLPIPNTMPNFKTSGN